MQVTSAGPIRGHLMQVTSAGPIRGHLMQVTSAGPIRGHLYASDKCRTNKRSPVCKGSALLNINLVHLLILHNHSEYEVLEYNRSYRNQFSE